MKQTNVTPTSVSFTWKKEASKFKATSFVLMISKEQGGMVQRVWRRSQSGKYTFSRLDPGTSYIVTAHARSGTTRGPESSFTLTTPRLGGKEYLILCIHFFITMKK